MKAERRNIPTTAEVITSVERWGDGILARARKLQRPHVVKIQRPVSEFPQLFVTVPDSWDTIKIAPIYDVHIGHSSHDKALFAKHVDWIQRTPNLLTFNGGDLIENANKLSVGAGVFEQTTSPQNQAFEGIIQVSRIRHKMLFSLPGNHEDRTPVYSGVDLAHWISEGLNIPYFPDYCFCTLKWRGNNFRILAHHGSGSATTAGAQVMAARKALPWAKPVDIYWTGHLHSPRVDVQYQTDVDQKTGLMVERNALVMISPSYLGYFGTYAAKGQYAPGPRGLAVVELHDDGRMDVSVHARGKRF